MRENICCSGYPNCAHNMTTQPKMSEHKCELCGTPVKVIGHTTKHYEPILKPCLCPKTEARTVKRITSQIWQCPRCSGLGSIIEPAASVPTTEQISERIGLMSDVSTNQYERDRIAIAIHDLLTEGKVKGKKNFDIEDLDGESND